MLVNSHSPEIHFLQVDPLTKGSRTLPDSMISRGPHVQVHEPTGDISHQSKLAVIIQPMLEYIISINSEFIKMTLIIL